MSPGGMAVAASVLCLIFPCFFWSLRDRSVWSWDQAWYGEVALDLFEAQRHGPLALSKAMLSALGMKPPLLTWLAQFFVYLTPLFGRAEPALLLVNEVCAMATLAVVYAAGIRLGASRLASLAGMLICGGAPLFIGMSNQFLVEPLQMLCAAVLLLLSVSFERISRVRLAALLLLALAASFLVKSSSFTFVLPVLAYMAVGCALSGSRRSPTQRTELVDRALVVAAVLSGGAAIAWYVINWTPMTRHFFDSTSNSGVALAYGSVGTTASKFAFWSRALAQALSLTAWLPICVSIIAIAAFAFSTYRTVFHAHWRQWPHRALESGLLFGGLVSGTIIVSVYGLATIINEETRFLAPLIPCFGILASWALSIFRSRALCVVLILAASVNAGVVISFSLGQNPFDIVPSVWLKPYESDDASMRRLNLAVAMSCPKLNGTQIIGVDYRSFNANSAAFYSAQQRLTRGYRCFYTSLGYAETDVTKALARLNAIDPDYFVTIDPDRQIAADVFNQVSLPVASALLHDPRFEKVQTSDKSLLVLRRIQ